MGGFHWKVQGGIWGPKRSGHGAPHNRTGFVWTVQMVERIQLCCFLSVFPGAAGKISVCFSLLLSKMECMAT